VGDLLGPSLRDASSVQAGIAAFGEMVAVLWLEGKREAAIQLAQLWEELTGRNPVSLLCAYPLAYFSRSEDQEFFARVCAHHTSVIPAESFLSGTAEEELAREVAGLQQRAEALAREVEARKRAEAHLRATNAEVEAMVRQRTETLRKLSLQIIKLQEVERRRVARELHESVGQDFAGLKMNLDMARRSPHDPQVWENCDRLLEHCINKVRTLSNLLHPPLIEDAGLPSAAEWYVQDFARRTGLEVSAYGLQALIALSDSASIVAFRALQEFLINAYRHSRATRVEVFAFKGEGTVTLTVADTGKGMDAEKIKNFNSSGGGMGVGLTGIYERVRDLGGHCRIQCILQGTEVSITVPVIN
jgi:signal transduction histidine kinase